MELKIRPEDAVIKPEAVYKPDPFDTRRLCACGRMFTPYRSFQRYCCDEHRIKYGKGKQTSYVKKPYTIVKCKECGKEFRTNDSKRHYCDSTCYEAYQSKRRAPVEERMCMICGQTFYSSHWSKRYCSEVCRMEARK